MLKLLMVVFLSGCAASSYVIKQNELLPYKESSQITKINFDSLPVEILSVEDVRKKADLGFAYTGVEYKKTPVYLNTEVEFLLKDFLSNSFSVRNIQVVKNAPIGIEVKIRELTVHEVIEKMKPEKAYCKLGLSFEINTKKAQWKGNYVTEFTSAGDMSDGTERLAPSLASCMNNLVEKLISDEKFTAMLNKEEKNE